MKKILLVLMVMILIVICLAGCTSAPTSSSQKDAANTLKIGDKQVQMQPTPTDLGPSIARYLLIRRAYWLNGDFGKSFAVPCPVPSLPVGQVKVYSAGVLIFVEPAVGGIVSRDTYLTPDSEYFERAMGDSSNNPDNSWLPDVDGTYGTNGGGYFWILPDGTPHEWGGNDVYFTPTPGEVLAPTQYHAFVTAPDWAIELQKEKNGTVGGQ